MKNKYLIFCQTIATICLAGTPVFASDDAVIQTFAETFDCAYPNEKIFCFYQDLDGDGNAEALCTYSRTFSQGDASLWDHEWKIGARSRDGNWNFSGEGLVLSDFHPLIFVKTPNFPNGGFVDFRHKYGVLGFYTFEENRIKGIHKKLRERLGVDDEFFKHLPKLSPKITTHDLPAWKKHSNDAKEGQKGVTIPSEVYMNLGEFWLIVNKFGVQILRDYKPFAPQPKIDFDFRANHVARAGWPAAAVQTREYCADCIVRRLIRFQEKSDGNGILAREILQTVGDYRSDYPSAAIRDDEVWVVVDADEIKENPREWIFNGNEKWSPTPEFLATCPTAGTPETEAERERFGDWDTGLCAEIVPAPSELRSRNLRIVKFPLDTDGNVKVNAER